MRRNSPRPLRAFALWVLASFLVATGTNCSSSEPSSAACCPIDPAPACCMRFGGHGACGETCDGMPVAADPGWHIENDESGCPTWVNRSTNASLCGGDASVSDADAQSVLPRAPDGGFCCPIETPSCNCFHNGGWTATDDPKTCPAVCDMAPPGSVTTDVHGCSQLWGGGSCLPGGPPEGGPCACALDALVEGGAQTSVACFFASTTVPTLADVPASACGSGVLQAYRLDAPACGLVVLGAATATGSTRLVFDADTGALVAAKVTEGTKSCTTGPVDVSACGSTSTCVVECDDPAAPPLPAVCGAPDAGVDAADAG